LHLNGGKDLSLWKLLTRLKFRLLPQGLQKLIAGNQRFMRGQAKFPTVCKETLADLAREQKPFATILGCSDSRVPPELIFDANFGELFIVRVAGNVISPEVMGSLQYAGAHLLTLLFVVLGHAGCGAVKAALEYKLNGVQLRSRIQILAGVYKLFAPTGTSIGNRVS